MSEHPGDSPLNRFRAFWLGFLAFASFGFVLWFALKVTGPREIVEPGMAERAEERKANLVEVTEAQSAAVSAEAIQAAKKTVLSDLQAKKPGKSAVVVPGSPTFLEQSQAPSEPAEGGEAPAESGEKAPEEDATAKPAEEKPAPESRPAEEKAAEEKPAEAKPAPEENPPAAQ